mmetsp:Transcript_58134/g.162987  ORF Transcript_58134/g.162987 Transcript_58134/m.162987 type:complete len:241 (-) Transcript_58134:163-885(-)
MPIRQQVAGNPGVPHQDVDGQQGEERARRQAEHEGQRVDADAAEVAHDPAHQRGLRRDRQTARHLQRESSKGGLRLVVHGEHGATSRERQDDHAPPLKFGRAEDGGHHVDKANLPLLDGLQERDRGVAVRPIAGHEGDGGADADRDERPQHRKHRCPALVASGLPAVRNLWVRGRLLQRLPAKQRLARWEQAGRDSPQGQGQHEGAEHVQGRQARREREVLRVHQGLVEQHHRRGRRHEA